MNKTPDYTNKEESRSSGFFILLSLAIATILISLYMVFGHMLTPEESDNKNITHNIPAASVNTQKPSATPVPSQTEETFSLFGKKKQELFQLPADGEIVTPFSPDKLIYSQTMGDWRVHTGIDIKCTEGTPIYPVASGFVTEIYNDNFLGNCIVIEHDDGIKSVYSSLSGDIPVCENESVTEGTIIGYASSSAKYETAIGPHIHLEMHKDGRSVSPHDYIKQ